MVIHLGLRIHEILVQEIGNIIFEILSAREKAECYEEVGNHSQRFFFLNMIILFGFSYIYDIKSKNYYFELKLLYVLNGWLPQLEGRLPLNFQTLTKFSYRPIFGAHSEMSTNLVLKPRGMAK